MADLVLAVDIGTSRVRAALFDEAAQQLEGSAVSVPTELVASGGGGAILNPGALLDSVNEVIALAARGVGPARIRAVGGSCMWHSILGVDASGQPTTPILTWADTRSVGDARMLRAEIDESQAHRRTGCMLRSSFWPAKLRWLARTDRQAFAMTRLWTGPAEWVWQKLGAGGACSLSMASGTGLFVTDTPSWDEPILQRCGVTRHRLPPVSDEPRDSAVGSAPWFPAIGDGAASNLGSGATLPGRAAINLGTSAAFRVVTTDAHSSPDLGLFKYRLDSDRYVVGGATSNAGNLRAWCLGELGLEEGDGLVAAMAERPLPEHGLTVLPYWSAERAPRWRESATGAIVGIRQSTTALDILQAVTEAAYCRVAEIADLVVGREDVEIVVSGGGSRTRSEVQRLSNILARPVRAVRDAEASLRGAAVLVLERLGVPVPPPQLGELVEPEPVAVVRYGELRRRQAILDSTLDS